MTDPTQSDRLAALVAALPELYQPIHGHPEYPAAAKRACADRLKHINAVHDCLAELHGRPLRVLDLGCAQGYFSLQLASRGASVEGIDVDLPSIRLCQHLAAAEPDLNIRFQRARVEDVLRRLDPASVDVSGYDLILGLSILHHIVNSHGAAQVRTWLHAAAGTGATLLLELALREEPLAWAAAQPEDPRELLAELAFVHELAWHPTHLSDIDRPLFVASNGHWVLPPLAGTIDRHRRDPHALARNHYHGSRRYFDSGDRLVKLFDYTADPALDNRGELTREAAFLRDPPPGLSLPALHLFAATDRAGWLVRERLPGTLLLECLPDLDPTARHQVLGDILAQLIALEDAGLYHSDLRIWNILIDAAGHARLLDYGAIQPEPADRAWPSDPFLAFLIFVYELITGQVSQPEPLRIAAISPWRLPPPYRDWAAALWSQARADWTFRQLRASLPGRPDAHPEPAIPTPGTPAPDVNHHWAAAIEAAIDIHTQTMRNLTWDHDLHERLLHLTAEHARLEIWSRELQQSLEDAQRQRDQAETRAAAAEMRAATAEDRTAAAETHAAAAEAAVAGMRRALSWRLTAPLRWTLDRLYTLHALLGHARYILHALPRHLVRAVLARPWLSAPAQRLLNRMPSLRQRIKSLLLTDVSASPSTAVEPPPEVARVRRALRRYAGQATD
ncbi:class I SAM-dependent methyltransferase [Rhabdochromatium marinum]|uniref:class I SAM-dependent methyltransferase n=1 Tax=Rhabdochromatium marinum TaxID=48729 RepID=UPI00190553FB|nr:class I SAM-dependent methyltransferase [Rhabdochromatium marinum]MBK1649861.1 hypothetical protein [Rhabdochromatium marinum]